MTEIGGLRIENGLNDSGAVPQVNENQLPVVAAAVHPAGQLHLLTYIALV